MRINFCLLCGVAIFAGFLMVSESGFARVPDGAVNDAKHSQRLSLARDFVSRLKAGMARVDSMVLEVEAQAENILPDGETLLLQPILGDGVRLGGIIYAIVENQKILVSLRDFSELLELAIVVDEKGQSAKGWYVRENNSFDLDLERGTVITNGETQVLSENVIAQDGDIFIPVDDLQAWFGFETQMNVSLQEVKLKNDPPFPVEERLARRERDLNKYEIPEPQLPLGGQGYQMSDVPIVDVSTNSSFRKSGRSSETHAAHNATIRTVGDFAKGTLTTQSRLNDTDRLASVRVNYKKDSLEGGLLGGLDAHHYEVGDVTTTNVPLGGRVTQELGVRVTNTDATRSFSRPTTVISGTAFPGWDVELFREDQRIAFQEVDEDGFYQFSDVDLYLANNNFRVVFYGPQGEIREETVFVPVDRDLLSEGEGIYDVSVSLDGKNTYTKGAENENGVGSLNVAALYERQIMEGVVGQVGLRSGEDEGIRNTVANLGASTTVAQALINTNVAVDDEGELASELSLRRDFGRNELGNTLSWVGEGFDDPLAVGEDGAGVFKNVMRLTGPIPFAEKIKAKYSLGSSYTSDTNGDYTLLSTAGFNTGYRRVSFGNDFKHKTGSGQDEDTIDYSANLIGSYGLNRLRLSADYNIKPDSELQNIDATYSRSITNDIDLDLSVTEHPQRDLTEYQAKLDWQAGFARISPSIRYNTERDFFAGLATRFGVARDPSVGRVKMFDKNITGVGLVSALVYLDVNGDGAFNEGDEPLPEITVLAPQNGRRQKTDKDGVALFSRMTNLRLTDVFVDPESLQDPAWISDFEGVSILPREGYVAEVQFPIYISGEMDGMVYARAVSLPENERYDGYVEAQPVALRNITLNLYNNKGKVAKTAVTDSGGFYYFDHVSPGRYFLMIDEKSAKQKNIVRPEPQPVEIGYDGTIIYGNDIFVETGTGDVPSEFIVDLQDYKALHPHIDFSHQDYDLVLNLGEYNSRLMMSVIWYKIRARYAAIIAGGDLFVPPSESFADVKTGKHTLRVGLYDKEISQAYNRCRAFIARDQYCKVEIYPSYMKQAQAGEVRDAHASETFVK